MKQIDDSKTIEVNKELENRFTEERKQWNNDILTLIKCLGVTSKLSETQVTQLSYRQIIQDKLAEYRILKEKREEIFEKMKQARAKEYTNGYEIKLTNAEKNKYAENDYSEMKQQVQKIQTQITYFEECVKTLDNLGFAIRNKIEIVSQQLI